MKRKLLVASLLALLAVLVCTGAMAACSYTWTEGGVKYTCSGTHEYEKGSDAWNAGMQNGDCRYFVYHKATTGNKWGTQTIIHSGHNLVIQYDSAQTTATCSTSGTIRKECSYCSWPEISNGKLPNQHPTDKLKTETKAATCVDDGYMKITCTACNTVVSNQVEKAHGRHTTASKPRVEDAPTCTEKGTLVDWCTVCDKTLGFNSYIDATGHPGTRSFVGKAATCTEDGVTVYACVRCGDTVKTTPIPATGHTPEEYDRVEPDCCKAGSYKVRCSVCKADIGGDAIPPTGHTATGSTYDKLVDPTCTSTGSYRLFCAKYHTVLSSKTLAKIDHNYKAVSVKCNGTSDRGYEAEQCSMCSAIRNKVMHTGIEEKIVLAASCCANGYYDTYCTTCGNKLADKLGIAPTGVGHKEERIVKSAATCTKGEVVDVVCTVRGNYLRTETGEPLGHSNLYTETVKEATCTENGKKVTYCGVCKAEVSSTTLVAPGHKMVDASYAPTCTSNGWTGSKCTVCGFTEPGVNVPAIPHDYSVKKNVKEATCTTDGSYDLYCSKCGGFGMTNPIYRTGHSYAAVSVKCTNGIERGYEAEKCTKCGDIKDKVMHTGIREQVVLAASCCANGYYDTYCTTCGNKLADKLGIAPTGTGHKEQRIVKSEATCIKGEVVDVVCTVRGNFLRTETGTPLGHKMVDASYAPTCTSNGWTGSKCTVCGFTEPGVNVPAIPHDYSVKKNVKEATCTTDGSYDLYCSKCGGFGMTNPIYRTGHSYAAVSVNCNGKSDRGYEAEKCSKCGDVKNKVMHTGTEKDVKLQPTCCGTGLYNEVCSTCGYTLTTKLGIPATGVGHKEERHVVSAATCTEGEVVDIICTERGNFLRTETGKPLGHKMKDASYEPTCTTTGWRGSKCTVCGFTEPGTFLQMLPHDFTKHTNVKPATCTTDGSYDLVCSVCDTYATTNPIPAKGHTEGAQTTTKAATCCAAGTAEVRCTVCKALIRTVTLPATGKHAEEWRETKAATCTEAGEKTLYCANSGKNLGKTQSIPAKGHTEGAQTTTKAATCCADGTAEVRCTVCKELIRTVTLPATGKHAEEWRETKAATCTEAGEKTLYCANSGKSLGKTQSIPAKGHTEGAQTTTKAATCCVDGTAEVRCTVCKALIRTVTLPATNNHAYEWRTVREATCTEQGKRDLYCANSGKYMGDYEYIPAKDHTMGEPVVVKEPTCCEPGTAEVRCTVCNQLMYIVPLAAKGHPGVEGQDIEWRVTKEATCTETGVETKFCLNTGDNLGETRTIPAKGHTEGAAVTVKEPTCCETGLAEIRCTVCNELLKTETLAAKGHPGVEGQDIEWRVTKEATCTETGVETKFCLNTGDNLGETRTIPAKGHTEGAAVTVKEPTCCETGLAEIRCTVCNELLKTETLAAKGHGNVEGKDYEWRVTKEPTCTENGVETKFCLNTGDSMGETRTIPATGHAFGEWMPEPGDPTMEYRICLNCGYAEYQYVKIPDKDCTHENVVTLPGYAPSCEEPGYTQHDFCKDCGAPVTLPTIIPATGHQNLAVIPAVPATPDQPGKTEGMYCADCGKVLVHPQDVDYEGELTNLVVNGLVVNPETGAQIGEVKDNVYTDMSGNVVGTFQPDGTLVDPQGNVIGDLEGNRIYDNDGAHVGTIVDSLDDVEDDNSYTDVDGIVINPTTGEQIGEVNDNVYTDNDGNVIGTFQPDGTLVDPEGNVIGDLDGNQIYNNDGDHVGTIVDGIDAEDFIDVDGTVVDPETGDEIGKVEDNVYTDNEGNEVGTFQPDGTLVDPEGNVIGKLEGDYIYDNDGEHVGTIVDGTLIPGHPDFDLGDYLDEYYTHVEDGEKIRPTIDEEQCVIGSTQDVSGENTLISGAEDYAICPNDNYPLSQWIPTGDGNHVRVCTCATCDYSETAACVYFEITVNGDLYKICPICGHFGDEQYKHIRNVKVGVDGHLHELICRAYEAPFGAEAATVKDYADEAVVIADSFTACKSVKGELMAWGDAETLYIPMPNPGEVTLVRMDMNGEFENVPFMYFDGRIAFNAEDHGLYLIIAK